MGASPAGAVTDSVPPLSSVNPRGKPVLVLQAPLAQAVTVLLEEGAIAGFESEVDHLAGIDGPVEELLAVLPPFVDDILVRGRDDSARSDGRGAIDLICPERLDDDGLARQGVTV